MKDVARSRPEGAEARLEYASGEYRVLSPGTYVTCAVTGVPILLEDLHYWSYERQEAYVDAAAATRADARAREAAKPKQ